MCPNILRLNRVQRRTIVAMVLYILYALTLLWMEWKMEHVPWRSTCSKYTRRIVEWTEQIGNTWKTWWSGYRPNFGYP